MANMKIRHIALCTLVAFSATIVAQAKQLDPVRDDLKTAVRLYELSARSYKKHKNPSQFFWAFKDWVEGDVKLGTAIVLAHHEGVMPTVEVGEGLSFMVKSSSHQKLSIVIRDLKRGEILVNGRRLFWDRKAPFQINTKRLADAAGDVYAQAFEIFDLLDLLMASAHADGGKSADWVPPMPGQEGKSFKDFKGTTPAELKEEVKSNCENEDGSKKWYCKKGFWIGVGIALLIAAIILYFVLKKNDDDESSSNNDNDDDDNDNGGGSSGGGVTVPPPFTPWKDAEDGLTNAVDVPTEPIPENNPSTPVHQPSGNVEWVE
jgi:hypothetical protein